MALRRSNRRERRPLPSVKPNAGFQTWYRAKLDAMIREMQRSIMHFVTAQYRRDPPETAAQMAQDESPAVGLQRELRRLRRRWEKRFNDAAPELARHFAKGNAQRADNSLRAILKRAGFSVEFDQTRATNDVVQAAVHENVSLIRSIPEQHLLAVEGDVMRSVQQGRDLGTLSKQLQARYGVTRRRAALIARDQNQKATAVITRVRQQELGIKRAVWMHSHAGKTPRPTHVAMNGKEYDIEKGMWDSNEGRYVQPGELISCRCTSRPVIEGFN